MSRNRILVLLIALASLAAPAQAQPPQEQPFSLDDPLARRIVSTCTQQARLLGPYYAWISVFSVPEPNGTGERLYVGLVEDIIDRRSSAHLWKGPLAAGWALFGPVPGYKPNVTVANPARYRVQRRTVMPGGRMQVDLMEIDLTVRPAQLRRVEPTQQQARLGEQDVYTSGKLSVRAYRYYPGEGDLPKNRTTLAKPWEVTFISHLLAVHWRGDQQRSLIHFLPMRHRGWRVEKVLATPAKDDANGAFVLQMVAPYQMPDKAGELEDLGARYRVSVGLGGVRVKTVKLGLHEWVGETWIDPPSPPKTSCK